MYFYVSIRHHQNSYNHGTAMHLSRLSLDNFRNYRTVSLDFSPQGALFYGLNGSGKTNLLESIFFLCTARSQRQATRDEMIRFSSDYGFIEGVFSTPDGLMHKPMSIGFSQNKKVSMKADGVSIASVSQWFGHGTVIPFGPDDINLVRGLPKERRAFIDILMCQIDQEYLKNLILYKKNLAERNALLSLHIDDMQLDLYEKSMVENGALIFLKRQEIISFMKPLFAGFYKEISGNYESASIEYKPSAQCDSDTLNDWKNVFYKGLKNAKRKDIQHGFSSVGPHRDDVLVSIAGKPARMFASQGQCTSLTLSLRMCSILCGEKHKKDTMIFLFDDALTYLDKARTSRVFPLLKGKGQIFFATSSDRDVCIEDIPHFTVTDGQVWCA
jgi:DNA replication and repair protein RecF